jgi:hypothetical protein
MKGQKMTAENQNIDSKPEHEFQIRTLISGTLGQKMKGPMLLCGNAWPKKKKGQIKTIM